MPQMIVEYSGNIQSLDQHKLLMGLNQRLFDTGLIQDANDIKSRIRPNHDFLIGFGAAQQAYIHVMLSVLDGRTPEQKAKMVDELSEFLQTFHDYDASELEVQLCVELTEMLKVDYRKVKIKKP